jgi:hypothetical protein
VAINCPEHKYSQLKEVPVYGFYKHSTVEPKLTFDTQVKTELLHYRTSNTKAPINRFWVISKYVKGGFPKYQPVCTGISTGEDRNNLQFYLQEDTKVFLCNPSYKEWTDKQNRVPTTFTETLVEEEVLQFHPFCRFLHHRLCNYQIQEIFWDHLEYTAHFKNPRYPIHPHKGNRIIKEVRPNCQQSAKI